MKLYQAVYLFVDDEGVIIKVGKETLENLGYGGMILKSRRQAVDICRENMDKRIIRKIHEVPDK